MKSDIKNFNCLFQIKYDGRIGRRKKNVYSLWLLINKFQKLVLFRLVLRKEKLEFICSQLRATSSFWMNSLNTRHRKSPKHFFIVDYNWKDSRLPWLDRVLLCLVRVGLK